ncbi:MAG: hypothetical protein RMJ87_08425 [Cytophagales bacterium]|nr:hypothetical protein [Cytophagales bacterium]
MDHSTEGVTLYALFINDILNLYQGKKDLYEPLFEMTKGYDLSHPFNKIPMQVYNNMCTWLEKELGYYNLIRVGRQIGESVYNSLKANNITNEHSTPLDYMKALVHAAATMIQDPKGRGWEIVSHTANSIVMRRTQTFNSILQLGLLSGLIYKCKNVFGVTVDFLEKEADGAPYDLYLIQWNNLK